MKQIILSLISATFVCTAFAANCVTVQQISTNYTAKTVTFSLSWANCDGITHSNRVWCFVDWRETGTAGEKGFWTRAAITGTPLVTGASLNTIQANGIVINGANGQSATITVTLDINSERFDWCAFASDCENVIQGTSITGCMHTPVCFGMDASVGFASTQTWKIGTQIWSAPVTATFCDKTTFKATGNPGPYSTNCYRTTAAGDLFNWCMVARYAATLCPSPWRVPTKTDFINLDKGLGFSGANRRGTQAEVNAYFQKWGAQWLSAFDPTDTPWGPTHVMYWASGERDNINGDSFDIYWDLTTTPVRIGPGSCHSKYIPYPLRCVK